MTDGRRCERKVVRRLHASFSGSPEVGNGLDGELAQLVPRAGLTSAQTDAVIPPGTTVSSRSRSLKAEFRRRTTFHSCTPMSINRIRYGRGFGASSFGGPKGRLIPLPGGTRGCAPWGAAATAAGGRTAVADVFGLSLNEVKTKKPGHHLTSGLPKTAATYSPNW